MREPSSPFLHRDDERRPLHVHGQAARDHLAADRLRGRWTLEMLRNHRWIRRGKVGAFIQGFGNWARRWFPWLDPRQNGGFTRGGFFRDH